MELWISPAERDAVRHALLHRLGFSQFRPFQEEVVHSVLAGRSVMAVLSTGAGKSLCYQLPALLLPGITLVISPLVALMKDQVDKLSHRGIRAEALSGLASAAGQREILNRIRRGEATLCYLAPERLVSPEFLDAVAASPKPVSLLVVDEAHCISQWGHDFRPEYRRIRGFHQAVGQPPLLALTATATARVKADILLQLGLSPTSVHMVEGSLDRPNLAFRIEESGGFARQLARVKPLLKSREGGTVIYADRRAVVDRWVRSLASLGDEVMGYHAGMEASARLTVQEQFARRSRPVVVATNAFGMGIDRDDIRRVIHVGMPDSLDAYYQEAGRAGRDGSRAEALWLLDRAGLSRREWMIRRGAPDLARADQIVAFMRKRASTPLWVNPEADDVFGPVVLALLAEMGFIEILAHRGRKVLVKRLLPWPDGVEAAVRGRLLRHHQSRLDKWRSVVEYVNHPGCRRVFLLAYFGSRAPTESPRDCCDRCDGGVPGSPGGLSPAEPELVDRLKAWRKAAARERKLAPYLIFHDRVLEEIAAKRPATAAALAACHGMGPKKMEQFGKDILQIIKTARQEESSVPGASARDMVFELLDLGIPFAEVVKRSGRRPATVVKYLEDWVAVRPLEMVRPYCLKWFPLSEYRRIAESFRALGDTRLRPVYDAWSGQHAFAVLAVARALYRRQERSGRAADAGGEPHAD